MLSSILKFCIFPVVFLNQYKVYSQDSLSKNNHYIDCNQKIVLGASMATVYSDHYLSNSAESNTYYNDEGDLFMGYTRQNNTFYLQYLRVKVGYTQVTDYANFSDSIRDEFKSKSYGFGYYHQKLWIGFSFDDYRKSTVVSFPFQDMADFRMRELRLSFKYIPLKNYVDQLLTSNYIQSKSAFSFSPEIVPYYRKYSTNDTMILNNQIIQYPFFSKLNVMSIVGLIAKINVEGNLVIKRKFYLGSSLAFGYNLFHSVSSSFNEGTTRQFDGSFVYKIAAGFGFNFDFGLFLKYGFYSYRLIFPNQDASILDVRTFNFLGIGFRFNELEKLKNFRLRCKEKISKKL